MKPARLRVDHRAGYGRAAEKELGREIDRHLLVLEHPIKTTGEHEVPIKLHHDVTANFKFNVKSSGGTRNRKRRPKNG